MTTTTQQRALYALVARLNSGETSIPEEHAAVQKRSPPCSSIR